MDLLQKVHRVFLLNQKGFIFEADLSLWIHPSITQNLLLNMMIRPTNSYNEYLLVGENGNIEGATQRIRQSLGLGNYLQIENSVNLVILSNELF